MIAAIKGLPAACLAGEGGSNAAVLECGHMASMTGDGQQLLAGRARYGALLCPLQFLCHLRGVIGPM